MKQEYAKYLLDKTREDYNAIAEQFSSTRRFVWRGLESLYNYALPGEKVLDLGCGNGRLLQIFKEIDIDYTGVDSSEKLVEIARKTYPNTHFQVVNALRLHFPNNHFDKVYCIAVLHHTPSTELRLELLEGVKKVLKPEGLFILTAWDLWKWNKAGTILKFFLLKLIGKSKLDFKDIFVPWRGTHQRYMHCFTKGELKKLVKRAGFQIKEIGVLKIPDSKQKNIYIVAKK